MCRIQSGKTNDSVASILTKMEIRMNPQTPPLVSRGNRLVLSGFTSLLLLAGPANAAVLAQYLFSGNSDATTDMDPNSTATSLGIGDLGSEFGSENGFSTTTIPGNTLPSNATVPVRFVRGSVTATNQTGALNGDDYFKFTLTPDASFQANLTDLFFDFSGNGASSDPTTNTISFFVRSSVNSYASNIGGTASVTKDGNTAATYQRHSVDLSAAEFQGLTSDVEFRLYIYQTSSSSSDVARFDNLTLNGNVVAVPEPSVAILAGLGFLGLLRRRRA